MLVATQGARAANLKHGIEKQFAPVEWALVWSCPTVDVSPDFFSRATALTETDVDRMLAGHTARHAGDVDPAPLAVRHIEAMLLLLANPSVANISVYSNRVMSVECGPYRI